jgi:hypothetical protein
VTKKIAIYLLLTIISSPWLCAQDFIVFGQVLSAEDGTPIEAANVWFKGTSIGTTTNSEGYFFFRNSDYHKKLCVSVLGYKKREISLQKKDEVIQVLLKEESNVLDELVVVPGANEALPILEKVRKNKDNNNPDKKQHYSTIRNDERKFYLNNIRSKHLQRKLFRELTAGTLNNSDSSYQLPVHFSMKSEKIDCFSPDSIQINVLDEQAKTLNILSNEQLRIFLDNQIPEINFYHNVIPVLQRNFMSPIANQGNLYYQYYLIDSIQKAEAKIYHIRFYPKNDKELVFKGEMWIDSASSALVKIKASMPYTANINFLNGLQIEQTFQKITQDDYFYADKKANLCFHFDMIPQKNTSRISVILSQQETFSQTQSMDSTITQIVDETDDSITKNTFSSAIDSLNKTRLQKVAYGLVDFMMFGYVHAWKLDIGPIVNMLRYNKLEGFRPTISLRTGESLMKHFTIGGYVGYGFGDNRWKYGGEFRTRFNNNHHTISLTYDNDVLRYGYESALLVNDNMIGSSENIFTTLSRAMLYSNLAEHHTAGLSYRYEQKGFRLTATVSGDEILSNDLMPFVQQQQTVPFVRTLSGKIGLRFSFKEKSLDGFFRRYYLQNSYPIVNFIGEYGYFLTGDYSKQYGKLNLSVKQSVPLMFGKLKYTIEGGYVFGDVPFNLLNVMRGSRGLWFPENDFSLINSMEFIADAFVSGHFRYCTNGWIFNYIPGIKKLNWREELIFKIAWGGLRDGHSHILDLPQTALSLDVPYIELGFGINNIFKVFSVESIWRVTRREEPDAINWGVRLLFDLDF